VSAARREAPAHRGIYHIIFFQAADGHGTIPEWARRGLNAAMRRDGVAPGLPHAPGLLEETPLERRVRPADEHKALRIEPNFLPSSGSRNERLEQHRDKHGRQ
jgi:hypothetical protein